MSLKGVSLIGPFLYTAYTAQLAQLLESYGVNYHFYPHNTQLWLPVYFSFQTELNSYIARLENCVLEVQEWLSANNLKLNSDKTEILVLHSKTKSLVTPTISLQFGDVTMKSSQSARNLGVKSTQHFH